MCPADLHDNQMTLPFGDMLRQEELNRLSLENEALKREHKELLQIIDELTPETQHSFKDRLTGLFNRRYFEKRLQEESSRAERYEKQIFSILLLDIKKLKQVNHRFGQAIGDETLRRVASFLRTNIRNHDICCRIGGDEFCVILPNTDENDCLQLLERIRSALNQANRWRKFRTSLQLGAATYGHHGKTMTSLLRHAQTTMNCNQKRQKGIPLPIDSAVPSLEQPKIPLESH